MGFFGRFYDYSGAMLGTTVEIVPGALGRLLHFPRGGELGSCGVYVFFGMLGSTVDTCPSSVVEAFGVFHTFSTSLRSSEECRFASFERRLLKSLAYPALLARHLSCSPASWRSVHSRCGAFW